MRCSERGGAAANAAPCAPGASSSPPPTHTISEMRWAGGVLRLPLAGKQAQYPHREHFPCGGLLIGRLGSRFIPPLLPCHGRFLGAANSQIYGNFFP